MAGEGSLRIDKLLWFLRFAGSRSHAQEWVAEGHIRLNGRRIERASTAVRCGDVLVLPLRAGVKVISVGQLPRRRGPVEEARGCYEELDAAGKPPLAPAGTNLTNPNPEGLPLP
jgi:ribosome-associated heat shock protein Hsp15